MTSTNCSSPLGAKELGVRGGWTRRTVLRGLAVIFAAVGLPRAASALNRAIAPPALQPIGPLEFLSENEHAFVAAACARFVPADDTGPGALEADAPRYITANWPHQAAVPRPGTWRGPFSPASPAMAGRSI